jgi:hypothetical protein
VLKHALQRLANRVLPPKYEHPASPVESAESAPSMILSSDDDARPSLRLLKLALEAARAAADGISLASSARRPGVPPYFDLWPGEHYVFLAALMRALRPKHVVEIGTARGLSLLAMKQTIPSQGRIVSVGQRQWQQVQYTAMRVDDFADGSIEQRAADTANPRAWESWRNLLQSADFVLLAGPQELAIDREAFVDWMGGIRFAGSPILMCNGIRRWNLLRFWRTIQRPKLDVTSFAHWSGSGLVELA